MDSKTKSNCRLSLDTLHMYTVIEFSKLIINMPCQCVLHENKEKTIIDDYPNQDDSNLYYWGA